MSTHDDRSTRVKGVTREEAEAERRRLEQQRPRAGTAADVAERAARLPRSDPQRRPFASIDWHG